jgi:hypothetical protein
MNNHTTEIPLTKGYTTIVDDVDADLTNLKCHVWIGWTSGPYATTTLHYDDRKEAVRLHRIIMERMLERPLVKGEHVDHIDGNGLNNRRSNLRLASKSNNAMNSKKRSDNKSGFKGVCLHKTSGKWRSYITINKHQRSLGYYDTPEEAHEAYRRAAMELYGEFARFE